MDISINGHSFTIEPFEHQELWAYVASGEWEKDSFAVFDRFIKAEHTILDIGAWAGTLTFYAAHLGRKVHALDADPAIYKALVHNVGLNPALANKIDTHCLAIAAESKALQLYAREAYGASSSSILSRVYDKRGEAKVEGIRLLDFIKQQAIQKVGFIKMDIEGGEFVVLPHWQEALAQAGWPTLYISFHLEQWKESLYKAQHKQSLIAKAKLKADRWTKAKPFKAQINQQMTAILKVLQSYQYVYQSDGTALDWEDCLAQPDFVGNDSFVFSNEVW